MYTVDWQCLWVKTERPFLTGGETGQTEESCGRPSRRQAKMNLYRKSRLGHRYRHYGDARKKEGLSPFQTFVGKRQKL